MKTWWWCTIVQYEEEEQTIHPSDPWQRSIVQSSHWCNIKSALGEISKFDSLTSGALKRDE